jgi:hypothetical protein
MEALPVAFIAANAVGSLAQQRNAAKLAKQQAAYDNAALEIEARRQRNEAQAADAADAQTAVAEKRQADFESDERRRQLARAQASERAGFAGRGVSQDGSGGAVLRNLLEQHDREQAEADLSLNDRLEAVRRGRDLRRRQLELGQIGVAQNKQWNLLSASARQRDARLGMFRTAVNAGAGIYGKWPSPKTT